MPGIVGIIRRQPHEGTDHDLQLMVESMRHEPYYVGNQYVNQRIGLHVGWLAHPGSLGEYMPLISPDKRFVLIAVGEHFSHRRKGAAPRGNESTEGAVRELFKLVHESQEKFLNSLNGWFAGVLVDLTLGKITVFNDRYAMNRTHIHEGSEEFLFASEAKSILAIRPSLQTIESDALAQYLRFNCVMGNKTWFKDISLLPGASSYEFMGGASPKKLSYFDFGRWEQQPVLEPEEFHRRFEETVSTVFPAYMEGAQDVGVSLSAGLDTRAILAAAWGQDRSLPCYTFGGLWGETYDIRRAREVADLCKQPHQVIKISEQFLKEFPGYSRKGVFVSDGAHDALHGAHDVYFNEVARTIAPIRLTGKFGSEVVRTRRLIPSGDFPRHLLQPGVSRFLDEALTGDQSIHRAHPLTRMVADEIGWFEYGRVSVEQSQVMLRSPYMDNDLVNLMYQAPFDLRASRDLQGRYVTEKSQILGDIPTNMGRPKGNSDLAGKLTYGMYWAMFKTEFIYLYATPHWLTRLDRGLEKLRLERFVCGRQKFEGYRIWLKTHLAGFVREVLLSPSARCTEFFDKAWMEKMVQRHLAGTHNYLNEINKILTVELIYSTLLRPYPKLAQREPLGGEKIDVLR